MAHNLFITIFSGSNPDQWQEHLKVNADKLVNINKIRVSIDSDNVSQFFIDRMEVLSNQGTADKLLLEEVEYNLSKGSVIARASFGDRIDSLIDEIKDKVESGDVALSVFAK